MKNNTTILYVIIGLLAGVLLTSLYCNASLRKSQTNDHAGMMNGHMNMDTTMSGMMSGLNGKTGNEFDKAFISEMIVHHQGAVAMAQSVLEKSKRPELIKLANDIISAQTGEITMMKNWQKTWFNIQN